jgi:Reverse transcriptase (RNA-dependent DNA polymerase)
MINRLPDKSSAADPMPTSVLKAISDLLSPYVAALFNRSTSCGRFPSPFKKSFTTLIVKKPGLDPEEVKSYRPISNLSVLSKVMERLAARRLTDYIKASGLLPPLQSGIKQSFSTNTAVLKVLSDLLAAVHCGDVGILVLLDLSAAFDTVDHMIMLKHLKRTFSVWSCIGRAIIISCGPRTVRQAWCKLFWHGHATVGLNAEFYSGSTAIYYVHCRPHRRHTVKPSAPASLRR